MNIKKYIGFILSILLLCTFSITSYLTKEKEYSDKENRKLATLPSFDEKFSEKLNQYANDQFIFRDSFMHMKSNFQYMLGQRKMNGVWLGKDGFQFLEGVSLSKDQQKNLVDAIHNFQKRTKINPTLIIIGDRLNLLSEYMDDYAINVQSLQDIKNLTSQLKNVNYIDVNKSLMGKAECFYKTDHHYTTKGAYLCFEQYHKKKLATSKKYKYDILPLTNDFVGTLSNQSGYRKEFDMIEIYDPKDCKINYLVEIDGKTTTSIYDPKKIETSNPYEVFLSGNHPIVNITTTNQNDRHLLIIKDSFANAFVPFLIPYYHKITIIDPRYYYDDFYHYISQNKITDTLIYYSSQTLFKDTSFIEVLKAK